MPEPAPPNRKKRSIPSFSEGVSSPKGQASEDGKIRALCMIRGACAAKAAPSWQDLRAVYSQTAVCGAFRTHGAHTLPKPAHFGYTAAICCHELAIFPSEATFGMHGAQNLPRIAARGRISRAFFHRQAHGNAPWQNLATNRHLGGAHRTSILPLPVRPRAHQGAILPPPDAGERISRAFCHRRAPGNAYPQRLANRAASSCGRAYCLAIALVPHESDGLFVQAVLCT